MLPQLVRVVNLYKLSGLEAACWGQRTCVKKIAEGGGWGQEDFVILAGLHILAGEEAVKVWLGVLWWGWTGWLWGSMPLVAPPPRRPPQVDVPWHEHYARALHRAQVQRKMLFVFFYDPEQGSVSEYFCTQVVPKALTPELVQQYVWVRVPVRHQKNATVEEALVDREQFRFMYGRPGVAVVDCQHEGKPYFGQVVSCFPFPRGGTLSVRQLRVVLELPPGTLTQRTMIYAVRVHPDRPASTQGTPSPVLMKEAQRHSQRQARLQLQGHHDWEQRFHRINAQLGQGLVCQEVVAESWAGMELVEAALDCVRAWRQSPGHWEAVRRRHRFYGYDIQRGKNGVWYATGLFAD